MYNRSEGLCKQLLLKILFFSAEQRRVRVTCLAEDGERGERGMERLQCRCTLSASRSESAPIGLTQTLIQEYMYSALLAYEVMLIMLTENSKQSFFV